MAERWRRRTAAAGIGVAAAIALVASATPPARAHPHGWIDVRSTLVFDEHGQAIALQEVWLFDEYYSAFAVEGLDEDGDGAPDAAGLADLLKENLTNLAEYGYFTRVESGGAPVPFGPLTEMSSRMQGNRLEMRFVVTFAEPAAVGGGFTYAVFDPTYYIEILHAGDGQPIQLLNAPDGCTYDLVAPRPDPETIALASMLDQTQSGGDSLGAQFAELVRITCAAP